MPTKVSRLAAVSGSIALVAVLIGAPAHAEPASDDPDLSDVGGLVDEVVAEQLKDGDVPGAAVTIVSRGEVVHSKGYGYADLDSKTEVDPDTAFYTASTAKLFTAAAVLQLEERGKLDLDTDVNEYLDFDIPDTFADRPITITDLLTHTAGFDPDYGMVGQGFSDPKDLPSLRDSVVDPPPRVEPPGTVIAYDNYGVALSGYIVERVAKVPYADYIDEHVYRALGMTGSSATQPYPDAIADNLATGYRPEGGGQTATIGNYSPWTPTGPGQVFTAADMGKFMIDQFAEKSALGEGVPRRLMTQQYTQHEGMPGLGLIYEERQHGDETVLFKGGDGTGFHNDMILLPEAELGVFFTVNGDGGSGLNLGAVADAVLAEYFPAAEADEPTAIADPDVDAYAGAYQSSRVSHHSILKLRVMSQSRVIVTANGDGTLTTSDKTLSSKDDVDTQKWVPIEPGVFQEADGPHRIAFDDGVLTQPLSQNQVYVKQSWYESPTLHQYVVLVALAILLLGLLGLPLAALRRRDNPRGATLARLLAWLTSAIAIGTAVALVSLLLDRDAAIEALMMAVPLVFVIMIGATVAVVGAAAMAVATVVAWLRGWWRTTGRLSYTFLSLAAIAFAAFVVTYNVTGPPFD